LLGEVALRYLEVHLVFLEVITLFDDLAYLPLELCQPRSLSLV
jgi:hypothetical protein